MPFSSGVSKVSIIAVVAVLLINMEKMAVISLPGNGYPAYRYHLNRQKKQKEEEQANHGEFCITIHKYYRRIIFISKIVVNPRPMRAGI
ncbi:hypothetical protein [Endozoicomonas euniceicola]|uniref:Secreted protein n=1 Tax=Endozoicomonas euniceicola TaxID=1234143 RepID=A0ABY6H1M3_9GAMM|nr:hypothetical protein [Endozoicomonas euniceicola]UYM18957.1 hypothetical protein NX720_07850 [Endozoicomonas euniceicola]